MRPPVRVDKRVRRSLFAGGEDRRPSSERRTLRAPMTDASWQPTTRYWAVLLPRPDDPHAGLREDLRASLVDARRAVTPIAEAIDRDLPHFAVHDETHLDALWPLVDLMASESLELMPTEVWTLGVAVLLHDLGLAVAAYPGGHEELRQTDGWPDALAAAVRRRLGRPPSRIDIGNPEPDDLEAADQAILRARHAKRAAELPAISIGGRPLVVDDRVRDGLGEIAGRIAASHWWPAEQLARLGTVRGAPAGLPSSWSIRPVVLGTLLRTADAAHLDALRAPRARRRQKRLSAESAMHWDFQERLAQPVPEGDQLRYTSTEAFGPEQAAAWWTCVEHLRLLDSELAASHALLSDLHQPLLSVRSVANVRDLRRLAQDVRVDGWLPVDARIDISDVPRLVQTLGGRQLYGAANAVPLRELIQNASDAIRARAALEPGFQGTVDVKFDPDLARIEVADNGVGMDDRVLTGALLDFGRSLWSSSELAHIHPGLQAAGFQPAGRFGIGFFSVFMWTQQVTVVSRGRSAARDDTHVLSFAGLAARPMLRRATEPERLNGPGTRVILEQPELEEFTRDWITGEFDEPRPDRQVSSSAAGELLGWLAPALPVDLRVRVGVQSATTVVAADDWRTIDGQTLLNRLGRGFQGSDRIEPVHEGGVVTGRIALVDAFEPLLPEDREAGPCVLVASGLRVGTTHDALGVLMVEGIDAARSSGTPTITAEEVTRWASAQARRIVPRGDTRSLAARVLFLGGDPASLHLAESSDGLLSYAEVVEWARSRGEITLVDVEEDVRDAKDYIDRPASRHHAGRQRPKRAGLPLAGSQTPSAVRDRAAVHPLDAQPGRDERLGRCGIRCERGGR